MRRNPALEAAIRMVEERGLRYRQELTKDNHIKLMIDGAKKIVYISGAKLGRDKFWIKNVEQDVRHAIVSIGDKNAYR